jgi:hypothetical protein
MPHSNDVNLKLGHYLTERVRNLGAAWEQPKERLQTNKRNRSNDLD